VGKISSEAKRLIEVARKCTEVGIAQCGPQKRFCDIGNSIAAYAQQNGFNVIPNVAGHGIGRHFHDYPIIFHCRKFHSPAILWEYVLLFSRLPFCMLR
jgi:methionyl aminopeptidase